MNNLGELGTAIEKCVHPLTFPVGVKLLEKEADIPRGIERATKAVGYRIALCQAFAFARHNGLALAMLKEDLSCPIAVMALGLAEPPKYWLDGDFYAHSYSADTRSGANLARDIPRFQVGQYAGLVTSPLKDCDFEIDLALLYVDSLRLWRLLVGALHTEGGCLGTSLLPTAPCAIVVPTKQAENYQVSVPDPGDRRYGRAEADELTFAAPATRLGELARGLMVTEERGLKLPLRQWLSGEPNHPQHYVDLMKTVLSP